jgi:hypothetical protein
MYHSDPGGLSISLNAKCSTFDQLQGRQQQQHRQYQPNQGWESRHFQELAHDAGLSRAVHED